MWLHTSCDMSFDITVSTPFILMLRLRSGAQQWVASEEYRINPSVPVYEFTDNYGNLCQRLTAPPGPFVIHTAADKVRWYEIEKRPYFIKPVRCHECSKLKNHATEICSKFDNKKIESLDLNETNEWMEAIKLLKSIGAKYNEAILKALENRLST